VSSPLAEIIRDNPATSDKRARAAWRAKLWRAGQHEQRQQPPSSPPVLPVIRGRVRTCQWITGSRAYPTVVVFCDQPVARPGCSYCEAHAARVYVAI
jgi:hypothetical protein